jgi:hypothetical protein
LELSSCFWLDGVRFFAQEKDNHLATTTSTQDSGCWTS